MTASSILLGQSAPLSGANAELGNDIRNGALAYFRKVNEAGGVHGRKIELLTLDDVNQVPRAEANTIELVEKRGVFALFGYASATLSRPALPTVEKHRVPFLSPFTGADPMRVFHKQVYNMRGSYAEELDKIVEHFVPLGVKRFAIVHYDDVVGRENFTAVDRALKKRNLAPVAVAAWKDRAKPDIEGGLKEIIKGQPDVVILTTLYKATADFVRAAQKAGFHAQMASNSFPGASPLAKELGADGAGLIVATVVPPPTKRSLPIVRAARKAGLHAQMASNSFPGASPLAKELGADGAGLIVATVVPPPTKRSLPIVQEYQAAIEKLLGKKEFSFTSLESYIAAKVTVEAMRRAGPGLTRESFQRALDGMKGYDTGGYLVNFSPTDHNGSSFVELTVLGRNKNYSY